MRPGAAVVALLALVAVPAAADALKAPFDVAARREAVGRPVKNFECKEAPGPVTDLLMDGYYADSKGGPSSVVDEAAMARYRAAVKPVNDFLFRIVADANRYVASRPARADIAGCVVAAIVRWADGGAMLGRASNQGAFERKWATGTISTAFLMVRDEPALDGAAADRLKAWLRRLAGIVRDEYSRKSTSTSRNNNHAYWAAWSVMSTGVAVDDRGLFEFGLAGYRRAMTQIEADGTLPLEIARKSKALHYHLFSVEPLVLIAETAVANGVDLYAEGGGAIHRLVQATVAGLDDPSLFAGKAGVPQSFVGKLDGGKLDWMEPYYARFPGPAVARWIVRFRPLRATRGGGDLTLLYGSPGLAPAP